jgi:predicted MFS family arabinose efflux permease
LSDKIGLKRAVIIGLIFSSLSYLLLPLIGQTLPLALMSLFVIFIAFEFTIVTSFSLITEILPGARATMTSSYVASTGIGRVIGALVGGAVWLWGGLLAIGVVSAGLTLLALAFFWWGLRNWRA